MKRCTICKEMKPLDFFHKSGFRPSGNQKFRPNCRTCSSKKTAQWRKKKRAHYNAYMRKYRIQNPDSFRAMEIKKHYGLTPEDLMRMTTEQNNKCKICNRLPTGKRPLAIDHCHTTGRVRGLLCYRCNTAIAFVESPGLLAIALKYLK